MRRGGAEAARKVKMRTVVLVLTTAAVFAAIGGFAWSRLLPSTTQSQLRGRVVGWTPSEPTAALTDQNGEVFHLTDERGKELVLFFGYTHCPDACPLALGKIARAERMIGPEAARVSVAFVTVDPERDTAPVLKRYVALFDSRFYGVTGSSKALHTLYSTYRVWHQKLPNRGSAAGYLVAHSAAVYMLDAEGRLRAVHDLNATPDDLAHDMKELLP